MGNISELQHPATVKDLLSKMDACSGFASLGGAVQTISNLVDEDGDNRQIVAAVLRDPALTAKLLNIANSSRYPRGAGNVSSIDQVLAILGLNMVKSVALSLALLNTLPAAKIWWDMDYLRYFQTIQTIRPPKVSATSAPP